MSGELKPGFNPDDPDVKRVQQFFAQVEREALTELRKRRKAGSTDEPPSLFEAPWALERLEAMPSTGRLGRERDKLRRLVLVASQARKANDMIALCGPFAAAAALAAEAAFHAGFQWLWEDAKGPYGNRTRPRPSREDPRADRWREDAAKMRDLTLESKARFIADRESVSRWTVRAALRRSAQKNGKHT